MLSFAADAALRAVPAFTASAPALRTRAPFSGLCVSLVARSASTAPTTPAAARRRPRVAMQLGAPQTQIGRPKTSIQKSVGNVTNAPEREPEAGKGAAKARPKRKTQSDEVPMYKVILLGDAEYEEGHVTTQLQKICQVDKGKAAKVFSEAQATGSSVVCVVPEEHAEFYAQQLKRAEIFVTIEKEFVALPPLAPDPPVVPDLCPRRRSNARACTCLVPAPLSNLSPWQRVWLRPPRCRRLAHGIPSTSATDRPSLRLCPLLSAMTR
jgi:ATP-dependent Clp protease adapter protein ClpS